ncbi:MAG: efflux RND transporter permease subunit [Candidatus Sumerlaeia bacterium]|nr:efflux RND transporter permease subunit [Candidatus Sumerlaeia bacterium]
MRKILTSFVRNTVFANLLLLMVLMAGVLSTLLMIREVLPSFAVENVIVRVPYPGAGPEEVEEGISLQLEDAIEGIQGVKEYRTISAEGLATAIIEIKSGENIQVVKDRIADRVNAIQTFPDDAERPTISEFIIERLTVAISIPADIPERQLKQLAEDVRDDLMLLPDISNVVMIGARDYEISIEVPEQRLREYGLTFDEVARVVRTSSLNLPGGTIRSENEEITIRTMGRGYTGNEYAEIPLVTAADGTLIRLGDIATVRDDFVEDAIRTRFQGKPAVTLLV